MPGRTYRESVRILRFCCVRRRYGRVYGEIVAEFLNGTRFVGGERGEGESKLVQDRDFEDRIRAIRRIFEIFFFKYD